MTSLESVPRGELPAASPKANVLCAHLGGHPAINAYAAWFS
jgi:hypothetical protein